jgi:hypothetical protein
MSSARLLSYSPLVSERPDSLKLWGTHVYNAKEGIFSNVCSSCGLPIDLFYNMLRALVQ